jgi:sulfur carrier protein ThiS
MQLEKYIGLKYKEKGRDFDGVDCWGLVRLIYKNELQIDLPSFSSEYTQTDVQRIEELIAQYKEGWESIEQPEEGSIVLFRVLGSESHVGIVVNKEQFLHVRENQDSAIENFDSPFWKKRIIGYFRYSEKRSVVLNAVPHPLRTERYTMPVLPGTTLDLLAKGLNKEFNVAEELKSKVTIVVNGKVIDEKDWSNTVLKESDRVEYRAVPRGSAGRMLALLAISIYAPVLAGSLTGYTSAASAAALMGGQVTMGLTVLNTVATMGIVLAGTALVNAIAPIRPPVDAASKDPGSAERQLMVNGGSNRQNPYGSIPVVLGKVRATPLLGSTNYLTYENDRDSYVSMLLVWGYGPLNIDSSTYKIGDIPLTNYTDYNLITLDRKTEPTTQVKNQFDAIYGNDITQVQVSTELVCDGNPESTVTPGPWFQAATSEAVDSYTIALHFPQGLRKIKIKGDGSGDSFATSVQFRIEYSTNGGTSWTLQETLTIGGDSPKKDGFTTTKTYSFPSKPSQMIVRVRRETGDNTEDSPDYRYYFTSILQNVTFTRNANPAIDPLNTKIAKTAFKIKATDQLNGRVDGVSAVVQTWCKTWNGTTWVDGATSNPAALFRYVLEHPANPRRITDAATQINLTQLQYFHTYCASKGFEYNSIMGDSRSVLEVLRDICAAGRASPAIIDGKWTVIIDEAKPNVIQHFTPHNSWGFEGSKALPKRPDALRVTYFDQDQDYQENEIIVYDIGKSATNASLFESITLPGVTKKSLVIDHARWHMAQIKLRPEVYTINADIEYLVCNRGDRVKVTHDVPMWGLGSGRIKNRLSSTKFELSESLPMKAGSQYTIRIRSSNGNSIVRTVVPKTTDGYYTEIDVTTSTTSTEVQPDDLFLFGELNQESQDLIVLSVEPTNSKSARLTLVDYGVTSDYNIFNDYLNLTASTVFESQITNTPILQQENFGTKTPLITGFVSDESVMERVSKSVFRYNINVSYVNASQLPQLTESVEVQYDLLSSNNAFNSKSIFVPYQKGSAQIIDVAEGETYKIRMRYVGRNGKIGDWTDYSNHTVVGKTNPPSQVTEFSVSADKSSGQLLLTWHNNPEMDVVAYEVRLQDSGWGVNDLNRIFYGDANRAFHRYSGGSVTFYVRAVDSSGNYSQISAINSFSPSAVPNTTEITYSYADTSLTSATVTLNWKDVTTSQFDIAYYEVTYNGNIVTTKSNSITVQADWVGDRLFTVKTVDVHGNKSSGYSNGVAKVPPNPLNPNDIKPQVIDNTVMLYWKLPERTSLPIDHILLKKGSTWETAELIGEKKGEFTTITEVKGGEYTYWFATVDTEGVESTPVSKTTIVAEPPDFVFNGEFNSSFNGTKSSASYDGTSLVLPVNTTETWTQHFVSRGWNTPQDQINAGFPIFIQPSVTTSYYEEVFDYGQLLASSRVMLSYKGVVIAGNPIITYSISLSLDNISYVEYNGVTEVFGTNFRYIKVRINVTGSSTVDVYSISDLSIRLDAKLKNDAGSVQALSTDSLGTIVNFNKEFIDVQSVTVSPSGTTPIIPVYDIKDSILSATYSVTSNICTVTCANHGFITGQNVKMSISSGIGISNTYTITSHTTNTFTVSMIVANTSGNTLLYAQSMRVYLFNTSGSRVSSNVSWAIKGY